MNQPRILSIKIDGVNVFNNNIFEFCFINKQNVHTDKDVENMFNLFSSIYLPRMTSIVGINASGKSTTLDLINWVLRVYFCNSPINESDNDTRDITKLFNNNTDITVFYSVGRTIFNVFSKIKLHDEKHIFVFEDEIVKSREFTTSLTNSNIFDLSKYIYFASRSELSIEEKTFLEPTKSITKKTIPSDDQSVVSDLFYMNDINSKILPLTQVEPSIIKFLDPSIEYIYSDLRRDDSTERKILKRLFRVKFLDRDEMTLNSSELDAILSSGTKKGIQVFSEMLNVFNRGGYLLVDEIENHFNKSIILDIFKLFRSTSINPKAAMLVFSTHYTELIDDFDRNDMINITTKSKTSSMLNVANLTNTLKRSDIKKSDIYFSDLYNIGTATNYKNYISMVDAFMEAKNKKLSNITIEMIDGIENK